MGLRETVRKSLDKMRRVEIQARATAELHRNRDWTERSADGNLILALYDNLVDTGKALAAALKAPDGRSDPPEPVANPSEEWVEEYAEWYEGR